MKDAVRFASLVNLKINGENIFFDMKYNKYAKIISNLLIYICYLERKIQP